MTIEFGKNILIKNADMAGSFMSEPIILHRKTGFGIMSVLTGAPVGTMYISVSIDNDEWIVLPDSPQDITQDGKVYFNVNDSKYSYARLHYDAISGFGVCNSTFDTKEAV